MKKKIFIRIGEFAVGFLILIFGISLLLFVGINVAVPAMYHEYYSIKENVGPNYGLNGPHTPQGIDYIPSIDHYITSGYTKSSSPIASAIYYGKKDYVEIINIDGTKNHSHLGGIAVHEKSNSLFLCTGSKISRVNLSDLIKIIKGESNAKELKIIEEQPVKTIASFCSIIDDTLFVGEFYNGRSNPASGYTFEYEDQTSRAALIAYKIDGTTLTPETYYAIPNEIQGAVIKDDYIYLSRSYGLATSNIYVYNRAATKTIEGTIDGKNESVSFLTIESLNKDLRCPPMIEDLAFVGDKLVTMSESASKAYVFGNLYFDTKIVSLDINKVI